jgi:AraC family transcriptional regulator
MQGIAAKEAEMSFKERTLIKKTVGAVTIKLTDYQWEAGDEYFWESPAHLMTWRLFPAAVSYEARMGTHDAPYGRFSFFPANVLLRTSTARVDQCGRSVTCEFDPSWFSEVSETDLALDRADVSRLLDINTIDINRIFYKIATEIQNPQHASDRLLDALCTSIAIEMARHVATPQRSRVRTSNLALYKKDLHEIIHYIEANIDNHEKSLGTAHLCKEFRLSPTHLRRAFKNSTGRSLQAFVADLRLAKAKSLLAGPEPIKSIAFRLGFKEASAFSYAFKLKCGTTASEYRSMLRTIAD